jgi:hypothetical protein
MKKLILLFVSSLILVSCDIDDDGPTILLTAAKVIDTDLPEFFEPGEIYDVKVTYLLPSACHTDVDIDVRRGGPTGDNYRKIYIVGVASYDAKVTECDIEAEEDELEREDTFHVEIGSTEDEPYTFYLWTGIDDDDENIYKEVVVPVGEPDVTEE